VCAHARVCMCACMHMYVCKPRTASTCLEKRVQACFNRCQDELSNSSNLDSDTCFFVNIWHCCYPTTVHIFISWRASVKIPSMTFHKCLCASLFLTHKVINHPVSSTVILKPHPQPFSGLNTSSTEGNANGLASTTAASQSVISVLPAKESPGGVDSNRFQVPTVNVLYQEVWGQGLQIPLSQAHCARL
jgi:hypothetical protein